mgnify:CR=1 FL=1
MAGKDGTDRQPVAPRKGLWHVLDATRYSWAGFRRLMRETAARQEMAFGAAGLVLLVWAGATAAELGIFALLFLNNLCLNLAKGSHVAAWLSSWIPHLIFGTLGLILLHYRSQNKDLPKLALTRFFRTSKAKIARPRNRQAA